MGAQWSECCSRNTNNFVQEGDPETVGFLSKVNLFRRLPSHLLSVLATACQKKDYPKGHTIIEQSDYGAEFYIIITGTVSVHVNGNQVATLASGDYFGEMALLRDEPRSATIVTDEEVEALMITREKFREMGLQEKLEFPKRQAVAGGAARKFETQPPSKKTADDRRMIGEALRGNHNLKEIVTFDDSRIQQVCDVLWEQKVCKGERIIEQGADGDYFYMVKEGSFEIYVETYKDEEDGDNDSPMSPNRKIAQSEHVTSVSKGDSFGELALLYLAPRAATVQAQEYSVVWVIDRYNFKKILAKSADDFAKEHVKYLDTMDVFKALKAEEKYEVAKELIERNFCGGECLYEQGEPGSTFYILCEGEIAVIEDGKQIKRVKGSQGNVEIFGELALLGDGIRSKTIQAITDIKTLSMDKMSFDHLIGPLKEIQMRGKNGSVAAIKHRFSQPIERREGQQPISRKDLSKGELLGCGGFGFVEMVTHTPTQKSYALKALSKGYVSKCGMQVETLREKEVHFKCDSDFIIRLYETYNGKVHLYFLLEVALGGELFSTYNKKGFHGSVQHARFYIAGTTFAIDHMHDKKIVYRDMKPENLLLAEQGHLKLTDMGLAKVVVGKTYTTCGTPDYFAPEVIASTGHTLAVDWWCLGILLFELMVGHAPFEAATPMLICSKINKGISAVRFPPKVRGSCEDLILSLCKKDPSDRLPMRKGRIDNIMSHGWYKGFDAESMKNGTMTPPYKPIVMGGQDSTNFQASREDMPPQVKYKDDGSGWDEGFATMKDE